MAKVWQCPYFFFAAAGGLQYLDLATLATIDEVEGAHRATVRKLGQWNAPSVLDCAYRGDLRNDFGSKLVRLFSSRSVRSQAQFGCKFSSKDRDRIG